MVGGGVAAGGGGYIPLPLTMNNNIYLQVIKGDKRCWRGYVGSSLSKAAIAHCAFAHTHAHTHTRDGLFTHTTPANIMSIDSGAALGESCISPRASTPQMNPCSFSSTCRNAALHTRLFVLGRPGLVARCFVSAVRSDLPRTT